jgi:hypothetical protein
MQTQKVLRPGKLAIRHLAIRYLAPMAALAIALMLPACTIQHKEDADKKDVKIETPFGNMQVRADDKKPADTGLTPYPNSHLKEKSGDDSHSANVDMNFGPFGMKVVAATFITDDPVEKVKDFYLKDMARYGNVLDCKGGIDDHGEGLVCKPSKHDAEIELGVGNKERRRIVGIKHRGTQTEFSLVYLALRGDKEGEL